MKAIIYGTPTCSYCVQAKKLCEANGIEVDYKTVGTDITREALEEQVGAPVRTVPQIFVVAGGFTEYVGGYTQLEARLRG